MRLIDLSQPIFDRCPNAPPHPTVRSEVLVDHERGDWHLEVLTPSNHTGSHLDAPLHKIKGGATIDAIPLEQFVGPAWIADLRHLKADARIGQTELRASLPELQRGGIALLATGWGDKRARTDEWWHHSPKLSVEGAEWFVERGARGVGIDHYSISGIEEPLVSETHAALLGSGVWILEELRFPVELFELPQPLQFWALPVNLRGHSGSWRRPVVVAER